MIATGSSPVSPIASIPVLSHAVVTIRISLQHADLGPIPLTRATLFQRAARSSVGARPSSSRSEATAW